MGDNGSRRSNTLEEHLNLVFICVSAAALVLASIAVSTSGHLDHRVDSVTTVHGASGASRIAAAATSATQLATVNKASGSLTMHPLCKSNPQMCANLVEVSHRLTQGVNCSAVRSGAFSFKGADVVLHDGDMTLCAGPTFSDKDGGKAPVVGACEIEVAGVCVYHKGENIAIDYHKDFGTSDSGKARRGQWSVDAGVGYSQMEGANAHVGLTYSW